MLYLDLSASTQCHVLIGGSSGYGKTNIAKFMLTAVVTNYSYQDEVLAKGRFKIIKILKQTPITRTL